MGYSLGQRCIGRAWCPLDFSDRSWLAQEPWSWLITPCSLTSITYEISTDNTDQQHLALFFRQYSHLAVPLFPASKNKYMWVRESLWSSRSSTPDRVPSPGPHLSFCRSLVPRGSQVPVMFFWAFVVGERGLLWKPEIPRVNSTDLEELTLSNKHIRLNRKKKKSMNWESVGLWL